MLAEFYNTEIMSSLQTLLQSAVSARSAFHRRVYVRITQSVINKTLSFLYFVTQRSRVRRVTAISLSCWYFIAAKVTVCAVLVFRRTGHLLCFSSPRATRWFLIQRSNARFDFFFPTVDCILDVCIVCGLFVSERNLWTDRRQNGVLQMFYNDPKRNPHTAFDIAVIFDAKQRRS